MSNASKLSIAALSARFNEKCLAVLLLFVLFSLFSFRRLIFGFLLCLRLFFYFRLLFYLGLFFYFRLLFLFRLSLSRLINLSCSLFNCCRFYLGFNGTVITIPAAVMSTVPIAIRMPLIIALKFRSVPNPALIFVAPNPIRIIRCRT